MKEKDLQNRLVKNLKKIRKEQKLTQETLAEKAGLSAQIINDIEGGRRWPRLATLSKITDALDIDVIKLFQDDADTLGNETGLCRQFAEDVKNSLQDVFARYGLGE